MPSSELTRTVRWPALCACLYLAPNVLWGRDTRSFTAGAAQAAISLEQDGDARTYSLATNVPLRDPQSSGNRVTFSEIPAHAKIRTGNLLFDGLYAMAVSEAAANSVSQISDGSYAKGAPARLEAFQTGEAWKYVWTRDLSYSVHLALAGFDPRRAVDSLLFKTSVLKSSVAGGFDHQIIQDTGSGGSYPVSTDRIVWSLGADETLKYLAPVERQEFLRKIYPILCGSIEQDRRLIFDPEDGLYRGEQSFLDWREQTYPGWTQGNVLAIAMSKALSVNAVNYFLLNTVADYARQLGHADEQSRYTQWAKDLKAAINARFFDTKTGLYSTYLFSDEGSYSTRLPRYDLLGESFAILFGVADPKQAAEIIRNYPVGPFGPAVVWPQEKSVPIYHNQAMWPFVTAYWIKAARQVGNEAAVDAGIESLQQLAALNLSNMENYDFISGSSHVNGQRRNGPTINSRRQLWSVAGYLSMVQDVVFGLETSWEGVRFQPFITAKLRNETFGENTVIEMHDWMYLNTHNRIKVHLPAVGSFKAGVCAFEHVELNGQRITADFVKPRMLQAENVWEVFLQAPAQQAANTIKYVDVSDESAVFAPLQPQWQDDQTGVTLENGRVALNYRHDDAANVAFNIYRDGQLCAEAIRQTKWVDPDSGDHREAVHSYAVAAVDLRSGNVSHLTPARSYRDADQQVMFPAKALVNRGGNLVAGLHFENWGKTGHELSTNNFQVKRGGRYVVRAEFSNGAGPVNTGICCGVKKVELRNAASGQTVAAGYLVMPQSGNWARWDLSSSVDVTLSADTDYTLRVSEDEYSRNMSYLKNNERYTAHAGGGEASSNFVNIATLQLLYVSAQ